MLRVLYRISDAGNQKEKLPFADKLYCLKNCIQSFGNEQITVFADHFGSKGLEMVRVLGIEPIVSESGNAMTWRNAAKFAIENFDNEDIVYFIEDDYLHLGNASKVISEGLEIADYVTLYDHPDKYFEGGPNPFISEGSENCKLLLTNSTHWKTTNSTTMTFATKVKTLKEDWFVWLEFTSYGFPDDFNAFQYLLGFGSWSNRIFGKKRTLISSVPGLSTHVETAWLAPLTDWSKI